MNKLLVKSRMTESSILPISQQIVYSPDCKIKEECGIVGMVDSSPNEILLALSSLQHRGRDSYGISYSEENTNKTFKYTGTVNTTHQKGNPPDSAIIGHVRYSTTRGKEMNNDTIQPFDSYHPILGNYSLAHNGNIPNIQKYANKLDIQLQSDNDSEFLVQVINTINEYSWNNVFKELLKKIKGVYCLIILSKNTIYAVKDSYGVRPLVITKNYKKNRYAICSESCATNDMEYLYYRDIKAGEIIKLDKNGIDTLVEGKEPTQFCWFEYIYFMRPETQINTSETVQDYRYKCGTIMGNEEKIIFDKQNTIVVAMPNTAIPSAKGFSTSTGITYNQAIEKIKGTGRTFILPNNKQRKHACENGLQISPTNVNGKCVILVDDSIVRGNTLQAIVHRLRFFGAKEVHARIMSPIVKSPCFYGIDIPTKEELVGYQCSGDPEKIRLSLNLDSLKFLNSPPIDKKLCTSCFTGNYSDILNW